MKKRIAIFLICICTLVSFSPARAAVSTTSSNSISIYSPLGNTSYVEDDDDDDDEAPTASKIFKESMDDGTSIHGMSVKEIFFIIGAVFFLIAHIVAIIIVVLKRKKDLF